ncbi:MAG: YtxH domain-containing protein [Proteocatella sp.]
MSKRKNNNNLALFFLGTTIGSLAGIMFAQKKGEDFRRDITDKAVDLKEKTSELIENRQELIDIVKEVIEKNLNKDKIIKYKTPEYYEKEFDISEEGENTEGE